MDNQYVITISHLLGCGGSCIGKQLSEELSIPFVDRQILKEVADYLGVPEEDIEKREERLGSLWDEFFRMEALSDPLTPVGADFLPSDKELYKLESKYIEQIAKNGSAIILGRGGRYILRDFPNHFSVFVYADMKDRIKRVAEQNHVSEDASRKIIEKNDHERNAYMNSFTRLKWLDLRTYDLCINTSSVGTSNAVKIIKNCFEFKFNQQNK